MATVGIVECKANLSAIVARVEAGEVVTITRNGKAVAVMRRLITPKQIADAIMSPESPPADVVAAVDDLHRAAAAQPPARPPAQRNSLLRPQALGMTLAAFLKASL